MLKKLVFGGAVVASFAGLGLATPAQATVPWPDNVSNQSGNVIVCGNGVIDNVVVTLLNLAPVTSGNQKTVDCSIRVNQNK
jgi:hypothetical protein